MLHHEEASAVSGSSPESPHPPNTPWQAVKEGPQWGSLNDAQKRVVELELRGFALGGVALEVGGRARGLSH